MSADQVAFTTECVRQVATLSIRTALTRAATDRILGDAERFMSGVLREPVHLGATIDVPVVIR